MKLTTRISLIHPNACDEIFENSRSYDLNYSILIGTTKNANNVMSCYRDHSSNMPRRGTFGL